MEKYKMNVKHPYPIIPIDDIIGNEKPINLIQKRIKSRLNVINKRIIVTCTPHGIKDTLLDKILKNEG